MKSKGTFAQPDKFKCNNFIFAKSEETKENWNIAKNVIYEDLLWPTVLVLDSFRYLYVKKMNSVHQIERYNHTYSF